eukprot:6185413-Pleurochrysis_carterae.AAC.1
MALQRDRNVAWAYASTLQLGHDQSPKCAGRNGRNLVEFQDTDKVLRLHQSIAALLEATLREKPPTVNYARC